MYKMGGISKINEVNNVNNFLDFKLSIKTIIFIIIAWIVISAIIFIIIMGGVNNAIEYITTTLDKTKVTIIKIKTDAKSKGTGSGISPPTEEKKKYKDE